MRNWVIRGAASAVALGVVANLGIGVKCDSLASLLQATLVIGLVNSTIRPIIGFFTMPLNCMTFGLLGFAINALLFFLVGQVIPGFQVTTLLGAVIGPVLMGAIAGFVNTVLTDKKRK